MRLKERIDLLSQRGDKFPLKSVPDVRQDRTKVHRGRLLGILLFCKPNIPPGAPGTQDPLKKHHRISEKSRRPEGSARGSLTNYLSSKVGQGFDAAPFAARAYCSVVLKQGLDPILVADDPDVHSGVVSVLDYRVGDDPVSKTLKVLRDLAPSGPVGFVGSDFFPMKYWKQLTEQSPGIDWQICDGFIRRIRMRKSTEECEIIRRGGEISTLAMNCLMEALFGGRTEAEAAAEAASAIVSAGGVIDKIQVSHGDTIAYCCGDPLSGYRTVAPDPGDMLRGFIIGPFYRGYYLDPGRSAVCGNKPTPEQANILEACAGIVDAIAESIRPGLRFAETAAIGDRMVAEFGPDEDPSARKFPFFGHPNGLYFEGPPYISTVLEHEDAQFEAGMLIGVEAFLSRKGLGSVGFEQNYLVKGTGVELVTKSPMLWH